MTECVVCASNEGRQRISPGLVLHDGDHWLVEHAYPVSLLAWLVIVLKRHAEALDELTEEEARELGLLQRRVALALRDDSNCAKEYSTCFGEAPRIAHPHVVVASLLLVAFEIRQNTAATTADTYQAMSDATSGPYLEMATNPELVRLPARVFEGAEREDFSRAEQIQFEAYLIAHVRLLENTFRQYQVGTVDEHIFESYGWNDGTFRTACFREWWRGIGNEIVAGSDFTDFFEARVYLEEDGS